MNMMPNPIDRRLVYEDDYRQRQCIGQSDIEAIDDPVVILGDPGLGKTVLAQALGSLPGFKYCHAATFARAASPETLVAQGERIIVDGLDEIASSTPGAAVDAVLRQLSKMGHPPFILTCREADWRGDADRSQFKDDYGAAPRLLHLQPFSNDDARTFLSDGFPGIDAAGVLDHLECRGLDAFYRNPLTLRLLGDVAKRTGQLPERRAELLDRACAVMIGEENPRHQDDPHARRAREDLLLAAGALCAAQVLCTRSGIYKGACPTTPTDCVHVSDLAPLPFAAAAEDALKTRLFRAEDEHRFAPIHRVVAEYLGAKWLAKCFEDGCSERRIFSLLRSGDGVPTSLRGLHAWLAHFNDRLAIRCIGADPYAVLRYGDAETIGLEPARALLAALTTLSETDPYFVSEDWGRHSASSLMRSELRDEVLAVIRTPGLHTGLTILLLGAMAGTALAEALRETLVEIMFDATRAYGERSTAADAIWAGTTPADWETIVQKLAAQGDIDSTRLACNLLKSVGTKAVSLETAVNAVLGHLGFTEGQDPAADAVIARHVDGRLFLDLDTASVAWVLDRVAARARPFMRSADSSAKWEITALVRRLALRVLETDTGMAPERIWGWVEWLDAERACIPNEGDRLTELFRTERTLRAALLEHVLLTPCARSTWMAAHRLAETRLGLHPAEDDLVGLLRTLRARAGDDPIDPDTWRDLLRLGQSEAGIANAVRQAAVEVADGDPTLLRILDRMTRVHVHEPEWKAEHERRAALEEAERREKFQAHRDLLLRRVGEITTGSVHDLAPLADVYLGRCRLDFDEAASPVVRLHELLGDPLTEHALAGFIAVLGRDDLPTAANIAEIHTERKCYVAEAPMICGIAEMLRQGRPIDALDRETLAAACMAWSWAPESGDKGRIDIGPALEDMLFRVERDVEVHFRTSIEPQLARRIEPVFELYRLKQDDRRAPLAGRLAAEWLRVFPDLPLSVATELFSCALDHAPREMLEALLAGWKREDAPDRDTMLLWLSVAFIVEFERRCSELEEVAATHDDLIWRIRDRLGEEHRWVLSHLAIPQLAFIVGAFGSHWRSVDHPTGVVQGNCHPWNATDFIERSIHEIASRPTHEATEALQRLVDGPAASYVPTTRHALALQHKLRRDSEYAGPRLSDLRAVVMNALPETIDDLRACVADHLDELQKRMHASSTDMWEAYWTGNGPREETYCRNRLVEHLSGLMPEAIRLEPEMRMPERRRADFVAIRNAMGLPVEIKGQWHRHVWNAASDQLDAHYACEWHAEGRGVYIVLWFGDVPGKRLPAHPLGVGGPQTPRALREMLVDRLPEARRTQIDVFVLDVTRPERATDRAQ